MTLSNLVCIIMLYVLGNLHLKLEGHKKQLKKKKKTPQPTTWHESLLIYFILFYDVPEIYSPPQQLGIQVATQWSAYGYV